MKRKRKVGDMRLTSFGHSVIGSVVAVVATIALFVAMILANEFSSLIAVLLMIWCSLNILVLTVDIIGYSIALEFDDNTWRDSLKWWQIAFLLSFSWLFLSKMFVEKLSSRMFEKVEHGLPDSIDPMWEYYQDMAAPAYDEDDEETTWPDTIEVDGRWYYQDHETQTYKLIKGQDNA